MKVAFISSRSLEKIGGIETYMSNLLPNLVQKGHEIILYTECSTSYNYLYKGVNVFCFRSIQNKFLNKFIVSIKATWNVIFKQKDVDIIHYNEIPCGLLSIFPLLLRKKVIFQGHGFEWQRAKWKPWQQKIIRFIENLTIRINENITMVSQDQSDYVINNFHKKSVTITPAVNMPKSCYQTTFLKESGLEKGKYFLFLGRLVPEKKADVLIDAFNNMYCPDIKLVIAGDDPFSKKYIKNLKEKAKNNANILFTGSVFSENKKQLLENCLAFVIPSELEGLPITLLEAMSYGKVCIASSIPANKEALETNGIYFNVNDTAHLSKILNSVCSDILEHKIKGKRNKKRVQDNFTWEKISDEYELFCNTIMNK